MRDFRGPGDGIGKAGIGTASGSLAPGKRTLTEALPNPAWPTFRSHVRDQDRDKGHTLQEGVTEF